MKPIVYMYCVEFAEDIIKASEITEEARAKGSEEIKWERDEKTGIYSIRYKMPAEDLKW